jgi:CheY-like chemotaxis protein
MSLILAIEPNKNQAQQLGALVRAHLKAELVTAPTAAAALSALGDRIPDVVLTPALFGLRDEEALTERLRQLGSDASHVQTLAIPILAASASKGANGGILGRKKDKGEAEVGCDPAVFAEQIRIYLQRAAVERRAQASEATARTMAAAPASADATSSPIDDLSTFMVSADELDVDSLELTTISPPALASQPAAPSAEAHERRAKGKPKGHSSSPVEEELGLVTPPAAGPPLWQVTESIEDFYGNADATGTPDGSDGHSVITARSTDASVLRPEAGTVAAHVGAHPASPLTASAATTMPRTRRTPPQPDDWAYFDASQSAFKALIRRLDEIAGAA